MVMKLDHISLLCFPSSRPIAAAKITNDTEHIVPLSSPTAPFSHFIIFTTHSFKKAALCPAYDKSR